MFKLDFVSRILSKETTVATGLEQVKNALAKDQQGPAYWRQCDQVTRGYQEYIAKHRGSQNG